MRRAIDFDCAGVDKIDVAIGKSLAASPSPTAIGAALRRKVLKYRRKLGAEQFSLATLPPIDLSGEGKVDQRSAARFFGGGEMQKPPDLRAWRCCVLRLLMKPPEKRLIFAVDARNQHVCRSSARPFFLAR
jgi:hypothetical protein